jgi:hypothetical protein
MARPKSFLPQLFIERAERRHTCRQHDGHVICQGDVRLTMKDGREVKRYCLECAIRFLNLDRDRIMGLVKELESLRGSGGRQAGL